MSLTAKEFLYAAAAPRAVGFKPLLPEDKIDPLAFRLARKHRVRWSVLCILAGAEKPLTPSDSLGLLYFTQLVKTADDSLDRKINSFDDRSGLRKYLMESEVLGTNGVQVGEVVERCLDCFSSPKKDVISSYLDEMVGVHVEGAHRGEPGDYSFKDALDYRVATTDALLVTLGALTDSNPERFIRIGRAWQLIDDALDWAEDTKESSKNMFIGMATDNREVDYLKGIAGKWNRGRLFDARINTIRGIKSSQVKRTREQYHQQVMNQTPLIGGRSAKIIESVAAVLF